MGCFNSLKPWHDVVAYMPWHDVVAYMPWHKENSKSSRMGRGATWLTREPVSISEVAENLSMCQANYFKTLSVDIDTVDDIAPSNHTATVNMHE
jgi:hypothetical protein